MLHVFMEYKLREGAEPRWRAELPELKRDLERCGAEGVRFYLGYDQPRLAVEECNVACAEQYERIKRMRLDAPEGAWRRLCALAEGTIHVWAFSPCGTESPQDAKPGNGGDDDAR